MQENVLVPTTMQIENKQAILQELQSNLEPIHVDKMNDTQVQLTENEYCKVNAHVISSTKKVKEKLTEATKWFTSAKIPGFLFF